jgi:hypothetical protein
MRPMGDPPAEQGANDERGERCQRGGQRENPGGTGDGEAGEDDIVLVGQAREEFQCGPVGAEQAPGAASALQSLDQPSAAEGHDGLNATDE